MAAEDFSAEDDKDTQDYFSKLAQSEFQRVVEREKAARRREKILYLRQIGRHERLKFKAKFGIK